MQAATRERAAAYLQAARGQLHVPPQPTIRDLLAERARRGFVGRERELALLNTLPGDAGPLVLHVRGAIKEGRGADEPVGFATGPLSMTICGRCQSVQL